MKTSPDTARSRRHVLRAAHYRTGAVSEFVFENGRLASRRPSPGRAALVFGPAFFDLQCNGYAGVDFNHPGLTAAAARAAIRAMWQHGTAHVLPTLITAASERLEALFQVLATALDDPQIAASVPGFHLEGPFISPLDGARGAHPLAAVRDVDRALWRRLQRAARGRIRLVTLAPEVKGALPFIRQLRREHIIPALAHTMATPAQIAAAAQAGALLATHLGNGCPQMLHRHTNTIYPQLADDRLAASLIPDGIHLPPEVVRVFARAKGPARTLIVTDAMAAAGAPPGRYTIGENLVEVGRDRIVRQPGSANFAGSALTMDRAVANLAAFTAQPLAQAWDAASRRAWTLLRHAGLRPPASLVFARAGEGSLQVVATILRRRVLFLSEQRAQ